MDSVDLDVLRASSLWQAEGRRVLLVTVVRTWGSSPRPEGAMLAVRDDGVVVGSVSGGCIEDDIIDRVRREGVLDVAPSAIKYGVSAEEAHRFGLPCGGTIELVTEPLTADSQITELLEALEGGQLVSRTLDMHSGRVTLAPALDSSTLKFDGATLVTILGPRYRMLVIGAGQLSRYFAQIAVGLGFKVIVCDPRSEYAETWRAADVPPDVSLTRLMPDDAVIEMKPDARCAVVALTHDPKLDDLALMEALRTSAFYIGAIGSRRNNHARRLRLREFDLSEQQLGRLRGPAGIYIGSRTPPEIAVSILAEVIAAKNGVDVPKIMQVGDAKEACDVAATTGSVCG